ncbi:septal ring lytic transglycosylase RlpA family protein [Alloalcanivorax mobilis]|uniref:septal ring lytic transglycosylase RlpA family protein n=1 Tax=Alloalcanivorax mobilis TaxID=2019569 RepID=UPI000C7643F1|nr:septal ring lytic transglycosylase RlpA family protein [Alloalcanivorax mobilis]
MRGLILVALALVLGACATAPAPSSSGGATAPPGASTPARTGTAPGSDRYHHRTDAPPTERREVDDLPEPVPKMEPLSAYGNPETYSVWGTTYKVLRSAEGYQAEGLASWYGNKFHGYRTSSGEPFDMYRFTAAHRTLPLPSYVRVTNLDNGKSLVVRVNDRGPFHSDRIIDLSWAAAVRLGIEQHGTGRVRVEALSVQDTGPGQRPDSVPTAVRAAVDSPPPDAARNNGPTRDLYLQAGAFRALDSARSLEQRVRQELKLPVTVRQPEAGALYRVWLGPFSNSADREEAIQALTQAGFARPIPVN